MNELSDRDWERINAFHDGELDEAGRREMAARIEAEPAFGEALREVRSVSTRLAALRPKPGGPPCEQHPARASGRRRAFMCLAGGALAAGVAIAVALWPTPASQPTVFAVHAVFASQPFAVESSDLRPTAADPAADAPDLSAAALTPVSVTTWDGGRAVHYAGRNGCRLTYFRGAFRLDEGPVAAGSQVAFWTTDDNVRHAIVATGMEPRKFDAIADYLKLSSGRRANGKLMEALAATTARATRCMV